MKISLIILLTALINSFSACKNKNEPIVIPEVKDTISYTEFAMGLDLSYVNQIEDHGGIYKEKNIQKDPFLILKEHGANMVRLRLWNNPKWIKDIYGQATPVYSGFDDVAKSISRAKALGLAVNLDFHYSDTWADPSNQNPPDAWKNITDLNVLCDSVYNYTYAVLSALNQKNLLPEMVQIGNEINCGMMVNKTLATFPKLSICDGNWANLGMVINAGIKAVRKIDSETGKKTIIALHVADPKNLEWWFGGMMTTGGVTDFDVIGFSYYHIWHTTVSFNDLPSLVIRLKAKFKKDLMIMETAYPFTTANNDGYNNIFSNQPIVDGFPYTAIGQKDFMKSLCQNMMNAGAKGVMYWEPAWITSQMKDLWNTGSAWENCALFDFSGNITDAANYMNYNYIR